MNLFSTRLYERLGPLTEGDEDRDYALRTFCDALGKPFDQIELYTREDDDGNPGWSILLDADRTPTVETARWLAQFFGVGGIYLPQGLDLTAVRERLHSVEARYRGTPAAIVAAAQRTLTGSRFVWIQEQNPTNWSVTILTRDEETPDEDATEAAIRTQKPAGVRLIYSTLSAEEWDAASSTWDGAGSITWDELAAGGGPV